jgi:endogenous inhibitor of DNA gyrase (YacG/DUF329 family)
MTKDIKCPQCGTLFGKETDSGTTLTIKNRDLYRHFEGGKVYGPCRGCGATVSWPQSPKDIR